jgi:hypothetical protein
VIHSLLLVAHIAVLGYWLGAELVINSEYRFICYRDDLPFAARDAMMDHLMKMDQHVRYALILQLTLGTMLAAQLGMMPGALFGIAPLLGAAWIALVEITHRQRKTLFGQRFASLDRGLRYAVLAALLVIAIGGIGDLPLWLNLKLAGFAAIMACGIAIRLALIRHFRIWSEIAASGTSAAGNAAIRVTYVRATYILGMLWVCIAGLTILGVVKPV